MTDFDHQAFLKTAPAKPGVYRMLDETETVLYVGKARHLRNRLSSYFAKGWRSAKHQALVDRIARIEWTVTRTEGEALLLENTLIKAHRPRYNVLLRDDKSYPHIHVSTDQAFPRLAFHRGARSGRGRYFGPYPSAGAVRQTLSLLQRVFPVRQCEDSVFGNRSRPCLQYQIQRCTAPCVGLVSEEEYRRDVELTTLFLEGRSAQVIEVLGERMNRAAERLEYEQAARYRDQIARLRRVFERQYVEGEGGGHLDIVACAREAGMACVQLFFVRDGRNLGNKAFFPNAPEGMDEGEIIAGFIAQHYPGRDLPPEILTSEDFEERELIETALSEHAGRRIRITAKVRGERARWVGLALENARIALDSRLSGERDLLRRYEALQEALHLEEPIRRMECFDISHTMGEAAVASCVVFDPAGPLKSDYRRYNIREGVAGDDYGAMDEALRRRYRKALEKDAKLPDLLIIDGGKGQLKRAEQVMTELGIDGIRLLGIAKGVDRKPGLETLFLDSGGREMRLREDSPALHLLQQIRDEAHRFAITGHRQRRSRRRNVSPLEEIAGLGPKRRQALLRHFGGLREIRAANVEELAKTPGVSKALAERIKGALE